MVISLGNAPLNWLLCRYLLMAKQLQMARIVSSYKAVNLCNIASSVGMVPLKSLAFRDLLTKNNR